jgi:uncharacterized protein
MNNSRIEVIDALRGYALMGLFLIHMVEYYEVYWLNPVPHALNTALFAIFGGKAYAMFALLFGVSFYIILHNQMAKGVDFRLRFLWRLILLFALGSVHGLIYGGDILQVLAVCGLLLIPLWSAPNRRVLIISLLFLLQVPAWGLITFLNQSEIPYTQPFFLMFPEVLHAYAEGSFAEVIAINSFEGDARKWLFMWESGRLWTICGLSMLGFLFARMHFLSSYEQKKNIFRISLASMVIIYLALVFGAEWITTIPHHPKTGGLYAGIFDNYKNLTLTLTSVFLFVILYHTFLQKILRYLAIPGRMTLTIYISQSLICVPIFYGFGLGAWEYLGQVNSFLLGITLWITQIILAFCWFKHFRYGPFEWLWRAGTYTTLKIPFKK